MFIKQIDETYFTDNNYKNFLDLLNSFYESDPEFQKTLKIPSFDSFIEIFNIINQNSKCIIVEDNNKIIGHGKIMIEQKIHANFTKIGHIEDVITHKDYRNKGVGKNIIDKLIEVGKENKCYKIVLFCKDDYQCFYENCGFDKSKNGMEKYL